MRHDLVDLAPAAWTPTLDPENWRDLACRRLCRITRVDGPRCRRLRSRPLYSHRLRRGSFVGGGGMGRRAAWALGTPQARRRCGSVAAVCACSHGGATFLRVGYGHGERVGGDRPRQQLVPRRYPWG